MRLRGPSFGVIGIVLWFQSVLVQAACAASQEDELRGEVNRLLRELAEDDIQRREQASRALVAMRIPVLQQLRQFSQETRDAEARGRVEAVIKAICQEDAKKLYGDGRLSEALIRLAQADGATNPEQAVKCRISQVRAEAQELVKPFRASEQVQDRHNVPGMVNAVVKRQFGPWIMPILLEDLGRNEADCLPASKILTAMGKESSPYLNHALDKGNSLAKSRVCSLLTFKPELMTASIRATAKRLLADSATDASFREMLLELPGLQE